MISNQKLRKMSGAKKRRKKREQAHEAWAGPLGQEWRRAWISKYEQNLQDLGFKKGSNFWVRGYSSIKSNTARVKKRKILLRAFDEASLRGNDPPANFAWNRIFRGSEYEPVTLQQLIAHRRWVINLDRNMTQLGFIQKGDLVWSEQDWTVWTGLQDRRVWTWPGGSQQYSVIPDDVPCNGDTYCSRSLEEIDWETTAGNPDMPVEESPLYLLGAPERTTMRVWAEYSSDVYREADATTLAKLSNNKEAYVSPRDTPSPRSSFIQTLAIFAQIITEIQKGREIFDRLLLSRPHMWIRTSVALKTLTNLCRRVSTRKYAYEMHGTLEDKSTVVIPDTGAEMNTINTAFALSRGYAIQGEPKHRTKIKTLGRGTVLSDGIVQLQWAFKSEPGEFYNITFHAISSSPHDVMFGMPFLQETSTLNRNSHRITARRIFDGLHSMTRNVCFQSTGDDAVLPRVNGVLDNEHSSALADSGCEVNVMSLDYARSRGYRIDTDPGCLERLKFADGSEQLTMGKVYASWKFPGGAGAHDIVFDVLEDSHFDLVLGQDILFETKVFKVHTECVTLPMGINNDLSRALSRFVNAVRRVPFWKKWVRPKHVTHTEHDPGERERKAELARRAKAEALIASMNEGPEKQAEVQAERQRDQAWQTQQQQRRVVATNLTTDDNAGNPEP